MSRAVPGNIASSSSSPRVFTRPDVEEDAALLRRSERLQPIELR
jgi:hypothetical protein